MKLAYPAIFKQDESEGGYTVVFPDLPGCITEGNDIAEAILMAQDAACGWVLDELESNNPIPEVSAVSSIQLEPGDFISMVALDIDAYAEKFGSKAVRKNLTIPAWLNTFAEARNINFSKVLQDALQEMYQKA